MIKKAKPDYNWLFDLNRDELHNECLNLIAERKEWEALIEEQRAYANETENRVGIFKQLFEKEKKRADELEAMNQEALLGQATMLEEYKERAEKAQAKLEKVADELEDIIDELSYYGVDCYRLERLEKAVKR